LLLDVTVTNPDTQTGTLAAAWTQYFFFDGSSLAAGVGYPEKWTPLAHGYNDPFFDIVVDPDTGRNVSQITYVLCNINSAADHPALGAKLTSYAGGSYALRTYYIKYVFKSGAVYSRINKETSTGSAQESWAIAANNLAQVTAPTIPDGLTYYNVYVGVSAGGPYYLQNASPLTGAQNWQEPSSCPTGSCAAGSSLSTDTASFSPPASGAGACGAAGDTAGNNYNDPLTFGYDTYQQLDSSNPYWKGVAHFWTRGYIKFHRLGNGDANVQRKIFYPKYSSGSECAGAGVGYCYSGTFVTYGGTGTGNQQDWRGVWHSADPALGPFLWYANADTNVAIEPKADFSVPGDVTEVAGCTGTTEQTLYISRSYVNANGNHMQWADERMFVRHANQCLKVTSPPNGPAPHARWAVFVSTTSHMEGMQGSRMTIATTPTWTEPSSCPTSPNCFGGTFISNVISNATAPQWCSSVQRFWDFDQWYYWEYEWQNNCAGCSGGASFNGNGRAWIQGPSDPQPVEIVDCPNVPTSGPYTTYLDGYITLLNIGNQADRQSYKLINESRTLRDMMWTSAPQSMCPDIAGNPGIYPCIGPGGSLIPSSHVFNDTNVGNTSADSPFDFQLHNGTGSEITISDISITGLHATNFSKTTTCGGTLAAGTSCTVSVSFTPSALGLRTASLVFTDTAPDSPQTAALSGTGTGAPPAPAVRLTPSSLVFLAAVVGTTSVAQAITLYNSGDGTLNITSILASGEFARSTTCGATLAPAASCAVDVTFSPTWRGEHSGAITLTDDAADSPQVVTLTGLGYANVPPLLGSVSMRGGAKIE
jgi:hypothetical protein